MLLAVNIWPMHFDVIRYECDVVIRVYYQFYNNAQKTLTTLLLGENRINNDGAQYFADALMVNQVK
jgi:hypothetical protein